MINLTNTKMRKLNITVRTPFKAKAILADKFADLAAKHNITTCMYDDILHVEATAPCGEEFLSLMQKFTDCLVEPEDFGYITKDHDENDEILTEMKFINGKWYTGKEIERVPLSNELKNRIAEKCRSIA